MSESDILERMFDAISGVLTIFSIFFTLVSAYLAGLYLFLGRAPFALRGLAFGLLSIGFAFLGGTAAVVGRLQEGLFVAWERMGNSIVSIADLRNPLPLPENISVQVAAAGLSQQQLGVVTGWVVAVTVYIALFYLTFLYRWPHDPPR